MTLLPVHSHKHLHPPAERTPLTLMLLGAIFLFAMLSTSPAFAAEQPKLSPDVLVLVLGGVGSNDLVSINYNSVVELAKAQADLDAIGAMGKWQIKDAKGETKSSGGPKPIPSTSISFAANGVIGYSNGTLPLEPFITALKRFKLIEVDYLVPSSFRFRGLENFENRYVKIGLSSGTNSYRYRISIENSNFSKLDLPLVQPQKPKPGEGGMPLWERVILALGLGLLGAAVVYLITARLLKRRAS